MELCEPVSRRRLPRVCPYLTEDVHGIPEERMAIPARYSAVALDFALGSIAGPVVTCH
jgi:hypothetical protein